MKRTNKITPDLEPTKPERRDATGRFMPGHHGGPGRRPKPETEYLRILHHEMTFDEWAELIRSTIDLAKNGDWRAREWLSRYVVGEPVGQAKFLSDIDADAKWNSITDIDLDI